MPDLAPPSAFSLRLEEALTGWILPLGALALAGAAWGLYVLGFLPDGPAAAALAVVVGVALALFMIRPSLAASVSRATRAAAVALALAAGALCVWLAVGAVLPGRPDAEGDVAARGDALPLPPGLSGPVRVLVHAPLPPGGTPEVQFRLDGGAGVMSGHVERTVSYGRAGRSGRTAVTHDRNETWVHGRVAGGAPLTLQYIGGQVAGPLHVSVVAEAIPPAVAWLLAALVVAGAAVLETRLRKGNSAALAGMAVAYGLLVADNATPATAVGTSLGAVLLGGLGGALAGGTLAMLAKLGPWVPAPVPAGGKVAKGGAKAGGGRASRGASPGAR